jgi:NAD(P)-dependent dehydrogenase (short-subunit alcohol dehydrogenase family)
MTKTVVVTGSTRGIGYGLADSFLALGCSVVVSGRTAQKVDEAVQKLSVQHDQERIFGCACDVALYEQVQTLWDASRKHFGRVDIWINNAGISNRQVKFWELEQDEFKAVVETNILGTMNGVKVVLPGMLEQDHGEIYNMFGLGSRGHRQAGLIPYGTSKAAVRYFNDSLVSEVDGTPVLIGSISPGMVMTDFITEARERNPENWERVKRIMNIIGDRVETVTPWIARKILENQKNGAQINWSNSLKIFFRFLTAPISKRNIVD